MRRVTQVIALRPEREPEYRELHRAVWPDVLAQIRRSHIRNYSIHLCGNYLFAYFEYHGDDLAADMTAMAADTATRRWWELTDPCQHPVEWAAPGEKWAPGEELFYTD